MPGHHHRASGLKQSNKKNKRTKASKRSFTRLNGGKVNKSKSRVSSLSSKTNKLISSSNNRLNRLNESRQRRQTSRTNYLQEKRRRIVVSVTDDNHSAGAAHSHNHNNAGGVVPRIIGLISLSSREQSLEEEVRTFLTQSAEEVITDGNSTPNKNSKSHSIVTVKYETYKKEGVLSYLTNTSAFRGMYCNDNNEDDDEKTVAEKEDASIIAALDLCRVCDMVVFLLDGSDTKSSSIMGPSGMSIGDGGGASTIQSSQTQQQDYDHLVSSRGDRILSAVKAQGMPTPMVLLVNYEGGNNNNNDDDDETMSLLSCQSFKSARRSGIKKRLELKKYVTRFATTEFGENSKVADLDIPNDNLDDASTTFLSSSSSLTRSKKIFSSNDTKRRDNYPSRAALIRTFCCLAASPAKWVTNMPRAYLLSDGAANSNHHTNMDSSNKNTTTTTGHVYQPSTKELKITGYIRGKSPLDVDSLIHIPNVGTFPIKCIERANLPRALLVSGHHPNKTSKDNDTAIIATEETTIIAESDPMNREPIDMFATPDALEGEQNLVGFDEDNTFDNDYDDDDDDTLDGNTNEKNAFKKGIARPAGWNDYQNAWLDAIGDDNEQQEQQDHGELAFALNQKQSGTADDDDDLMDDDANDVTAEERKALLQQRRRRQDQKDDLMFPDELEIKEDEKASERLARFRSLTSFRKSYWDPKENLPDSYSTIYHFASFKATQSDVMADMKDLIEAAHTAWTESNNASKDKQDKNDNDDMMIEHGKGDEESDSNSMLDGCVSSGSYITITLEDVSAAAYSRINPSSLLVAVSLLPHENKVSVMHMGLSQTTQCDNNDDNTSPVKSKDILTFRCGWRTWQGRPIFSQNNLNSDKHKFERFLPTGGAFFASSVFGPVTYTPCPVLVFREPQNYDHNIPSAVKQRQLIAIGSVINSDADRIIVKRVVLTGFPTRVHKRHATVKYMFYDPEDVKWFKPAGLTTKHGLQGNIVQSVGDHGTMKCLFNAPIKQHDTVCLPLYKRIYPKYAPTDTVADDGTTIIKKDLLVL